MNKQIIKQNEIKYYFCKKIRNNNKKNHNSFIIDAILHWYMKLFKNSSAILQQNATQRDFSKSLLPLKGFCGKTV